MGRLWAQRIMKALPDIMEGPGNSGKSMPPAVKSVIVLGCVVSSQSTANFHFSRSALVGMW